MVLILFFSDLGANFDFEARGANFIMVCIYTYVIIVGAGASCVEWPKVSFPNYTPGPLSN